MFSSHLRLTLAGPGTILMLVKGTGFLAPIFQWEAGCELATSLGPILKYLMNGSDINYRKQIKLVDPLFPVVL